MTLPAFSWTFAAFRNEARVLRTLSEVVHPTLQAWERRGTPLTAEILIVDNDARQSGREAFVEQVHALHGSRAKQTPLRFISLPENRAYAGAVNAAVREASHDFLVYTCANHCRYHTEHWIEGLLRPFELHESIGMTGSLFSCPPARLYNLPPNPPLHVQGGIFAARTAVLGDVPYDELQDPHLHSDIRQSYRLRAAGFELYPAHLVRSLPIGGDDQDNPAGLVHEYAGQKPFCRYEYRYNHEGEIGPITELHSLSARADLHRKLGLPPP